MIYQVNRAFVQAVIVIFTIGAAMGIIVGFVVGRTTCGG
jgi:hypothetical protein